MNKNYPIYKTTFIDDMRSLVEEAAENFRESTAVSYKENYWDKEVRRVSFSQWRDDVRNLGTALIADGLREENIAINRRKLLRMVLFFFWSHGHRVGHCAYRQGTAS